MEVSLQLLVNNRATSLLAIVTTRIVEIFLLCFLLYCLCGRQISIFDLRCFLWRTYVA